LHPCKTGDAGVLVFSLADADFFQWIIEWFGLEGTLKIHLSIISQS